MAILNFNKPKRYSGDCSDEAMRAYDSAWKAFYIESEDDPCIEIKRTFRNYNFRADVLVSVYKDGIIWSANGRTGMTIKDMDDLQKAIAEAREILVSGKPPIEYTEKQLKALESKAKKAREEADKLDKELKDARNKYA